MKILHIFDHSIPLHSGYTFRSRAILEHQHQLGWETDHITSPKHNLAITPDNDEEVVDGLHFFRTSPENSLMAKLPILNQLAISTALENRLNIIIPKVKPDILHAHSPALNGRAAVNVGKKHGIPVVYEIRAFWEDAAVDHGTTKEGSLRYKLTRMMETAVVKQADAVTTICHGLRKDLIQRGVPEEKITVIPNAVDINKFTTGGKKDEILGKELGLQDCITLGFIGSFYAYEGLGLLLEALYNINDEFPNVRLLLVGGGPQRGLLEEKSLKLGIESKVIFVGRVPHEEVQRYYNLVDIFVYPRLSMRLTELVTPLKPLEAMAQGRLVVASDVGGHHELIQTEKNGFLFKANDKDALAMTVKKLLKASDIWPEIKKNARDYVEQERNWSRSVSYYREVYAKVLQQ